MELAVNAPTGTDRVRDRVRAKQAPSRSDDMSPTGRDVAKRGPEIIADIWEHRDEPLMPIEIGDGVLVETYLGGIVLLIGGTGAGKTSLALEVAIRHAVNRGPAIVASLELVKRILGARVVSIRCDESWPGVLTGRVQREHMLQQWPNRLRIIERRDATIKNLHASVAAMRTEFDGEPLLLVVDYVQLMDNAEREIRRRVARAMEELDEIANEHRAVVLALSQGSRAASRQLASGERMGRETADAGAEAAELERWSVYTIAIGGKASSEGEWSAVDLSIGKGRIGGGDMVHPGLYCGRSGAWRLAGDPRPADEVRAERHAAVDGQKQTALIDQLVGAARRGTEPVAREQLCKKVRGNAAEKRAALRAALQLGDLVMVQRQAKRSRAWLVWTRANAEAAGIPIVNPSDEGTDG